MSGNLDGRVDEIEGRLRQLEERSASEAAALRAELARARRVEELAAELAALEARQAAEAAPLRAALARAQEQDARAGETIASSGATYPRLWVMLLQYQAPTLLVGFVLLPMPFFAVAFAAPCVVILLIAGLVAWALERRLARRGERTSYARTLLRHQLCPFLLVQPVFLAYAYVAGTFSLAGGSHSLRLDDFALFLAIMEGGYLVGVAPLLLVPASQAHRAGSSRRAAA